MEELQKLTFECGEYSECMTEYIACICFELNRIKANYPEVDLYPLISNLTFLIKYCDSVLLDNEAKEDKLNSSLRETVALSKKLDMEKKQRELELNNSFHFRETEKKGNLP